MSTVADSGPQHTATPGLPDPDQGGQHRPVLLHPLIESLQPRTGQTVVDGTLGAGGVTAALSERVGPEGRVIAVDRDPEAVGRARTRFAGGNVTAVHGDFADLGQILDTLGIPSVDSVALDLGISSVQLDDARRGFSFRHDGPLDMRMDQTSGGLTAADVVNTYDEDELRDLIGVFGEERFARGIAAAIVRQRTSRHLATTGELAQLVERTVPRRYWPKRIHPATRTFMALRIEVNAELESITRGLQAAINVLRPGGRLGVIAFHSLEDTLVKNALNVAAQNCLCPPQQPICTCAHRASILILTRKAIRPDAAELAVNPRARSARLRVAERLAA